MIASINTVDAVVSCTPSSYNLDALLNWRIPDALHAFTRRDTAFYALSVGLGSDPLDTRAHAFADPWSPHLEALPTMALVLGYPGFWLGAPEVQEETGVKPHQILHAEQSITLHETLPVEGVVIGRTRVTGMVERADKAGTFLHSVREIRRKHNESLLASCHNVHYLRGVNGLHAPPNPLPRARHAVSAGEPDFVERLPTRPEQALLYRLNGDANPLHIDPVVARAAGFDRPILHGLCTMSIAVHAVLRRLLDYECGHMKSIRLRMAAPVLPGDTIRTELWSDGSFQAWADERNVLVLSNGHAELG